MFRINVSLNGETFTQDMDTYLSRDIAKAMSDAVNEAEDASCFALMEHVEGVFNRPWSILVDSAGVVKGKTGPRDPAALILMKQPAERWLDLQVYGGVRRAGNTATTKLEPLVPGPAATLDQFGGRPYDFVSKAFAKGRGSMDQDTPRACNGQSRRRGAMHHLMGVGLGPSRATQPP
jgi:hypothetical protein